MFESDDFDNVLSHLDYSGSISNTSTIFSNNAENIPLGPSTSTEKHRQFNIDVASTSTDHNNLQNLPKDTNFDDYDRIEIDKEFEDEITKKLPNESPILRPNLNKRKTLGRFFDRQSKRKFPGPAGLLTGNLDIEKGDNISRIEILSQDVECSQGNFRSDIFESKLWCSLQCDLRDWGLDRIDSIGSIKQACPGRPTRRKAHTITAFIETIDRSAIDPLIILRDSTGAIKCTLHRDAWAAFSPYIISECAALALWKPTVFTTGSAFKKHYLTIMLSNIIAIYSSNHLNNLQLDEKRLPDGYSLKCLEDFHVVKMDSCPQADSGGSQAGVYIKNSDRIDSSENHLDGLDDLSFLDEMF